MRTKFSLDILTLFICMFCIISCNNDDEDGEGRKVTDYKEYVLAVASKKVPGVLTSAGYKYLTDVYAVKKDQSDDWEAFGSISGFDFEKGYEYKIKISETSYLDYSMGQPTWTEHELLEVTSKERKESEGLPLHFIPVLQGQIHPRIQVRNRSGSQSTDRRRFEIQFYHTIGLSLFVI